MDSESRFDELVAPLREDVVSGASALAGTAADVLRRAAVRVRAGSIEELRHALGEVCRHVLDAQPAMAPLVALVRDVMSEVDRAESLENGRHAAASAARAFQEEFHRRSRAVAAAAVQILPAGGRVATLSSSSTVLALLSAEAEPRGITVVCFESRPMREGRLLAEELARSGADVVFAVDAAIGALVPTCDVVVVGADSIGDRGVVNKIGTTSMAWTARMVGIPMYVLADETKILPRGFPQVLDDDRPPGEVWDAPGEGRAAPGEASGAPPGVSVWNRYFEITPAEHVSGFVTERGLWTAAQIEELRGSLELPAGLRAWAAGRGA